MVCGCFFIAVRSVVRRNLVLISNCSEIKRPMSTVYDDNLGFHYTDDDLEELAFFINVRLQSIAKKRALQTRRAFTATDHLVRDMLTSTGRWRAIRPSLGCSKHPLFIAVVFMEFSIYGRNCHMYGVRSRLWGATKRAIAAA
jgi:hypothetical protein